MATSKKELKKTAIHGDHRRLKGRLVDFAGWEMPVQYTSVIDEHLTCRSAAGLFDVSHMGEVIFKGKDAEAFLNTVVTNDVSKLTPGRALYSVVCNENGGVVDDVVVYRLQPEEFLVVVNAANTEKDFEHFKKLKKASSFKDLELLNVSPDFSQIAIQGPKAEQILSKITDSNLNAIKFYHFSEGYLIDEVPALISRTGYTGEDGFELYVPWDAGSAVWQALVKKGRGLGLKPCGLGARNTLRLEMKYPLYGNELNDEISPLDAGLGWVVKLSKGDFHGKSGLEKKKRAGVQKLVGIELKDRGIPRDGYLLFDAEGKKEVGKLTSGTQSPSLKKPIGLGYIKPELAEVGTKINVEIRKKMVGAEVVETPFYKRPH